MYRLELLGYKLKDADWPRVARLLEAYDDLLSPAWKKMSNIWYQIRCFFRPYNVVVARDLPRTWVDRDYLMFHVMFQIIVDFVELEQPFLDWDDKVRGRCHDRVLFHQYLERWYSVEGRSSRYWEGMSDDEKAAQDRNSENGYQVYREILFLYEWYKDKKYEAPTKQPRQTWDEFFEEERAHDALCSQMLERILKVRDYLWT